MTTNNSADSPNQKRLVRETAWIRVFEMGEHKLVYESKFLTDNLQVTADSLRSVWGNLTQRDQLEFSVAFAAKPQLTLEDARVLDFLVKNGPQEVVSNVALRLAELPDREAALGVLIERALPGPVSPANYYVALERLGDSRAVPRLQENFAYYQKLIAQGKSKPREICDYLYCCRALLSLDGSKKFEACIQSMLTHSDGAVRRTARLLLGGSVREKR